MADTTRKENDFFNICVHARCKTDCCHIARPPLTAKRKKILEEYLKKHGIYLENPLVHGGYTYAREDKERYCVFFHRKTKKCLVHSVKPETCVAGPVTFDINLKTEKIEWHLKKESICPLARRLYDDKERLKKHLKLAKKEIRRLVRELDAEALKTILKIEEPETFKIDEDSIEKPVLSKLV
jgi:Fe-S-cluster containining protein